MTERSKYLTEKSVTVHDDRAFTSREEAEKWIAEIQSRPTDAQRHFRVEERKHIYDTARDTWIVRYSETVDSPRAATLTDIYDLLYETLGAEDDRPTTLDP